MKKALQISKKDVDTIAAIATPAGRGGIGVVRISGPLVKKISQKIIKKKLLPGVACFSSFYNEENNIIDQGLGLFFKSPHSFTGEDVLELHGHGGPVILDCLLREVLQLGARAARAGEFSQRAFLNNKIDLAQAEAVADLINASSEQAARSAIRSLQGEFSQRIDELIQALTKLRAFTEASIDFADEEIEFISTKKFSAELNEIIKKLAKVIVAAKQGSILQEGMTVVIAGKPNAGKSSLLNVLSGRDSAIVTAIAGTTRDVLREYIHIDGMPLHIIDTAGLQESKNEIEKEGIKRAWREIEKADVILFIVDNSITNEDDPRKLLPEFYKRLPAKKSIIVIENKIDLTGEKARVTEKDDHTTIYLSAKKASGIDLLKEHLKKQMGFDSQVEGIFIARRRHLDALEKAKTFLLTCQKQLKENPQEELLAEDLRNAQNKLAEITGEFTSDDLLGEIFATFCIGK